MARLRYNGLSATLGASLTSSATAVTFGAALAHSNGTAVPTITGSDYIPLAILDSSGHLSEIVWLTAYTSGATTGTITRGKEGTSGVAHSSGDKIVHGPTKADIANPPTVRDQTAGTANAASVTVAIPSGTQVGDLLVAFASSGFAPNAEAPSGWQILDRQDVFQPSGVFEIGITFVRVAESGDAGTNVTFTFGGAYDCGAAIVAVADSGAIVEHVIRGIGAGTADTLRLAALGGGLGYLTLVFAGVRNTTGTTTSTAGSSIATSTSSASEGCVTTALALSEGGPVGVLLTHSATAKAMAGAVVKIRGA